MYIITRNEEYFIGTVLSVRETREEAVEMLKLLRSKSDGDFTIAYIQSVECNLIHDLVDRARAAAVVDF